MCKSMRRAWWLPLLIARSGACWKQSRWGTVLFLPSFHLGCTTLPKQSGFSGCSCDYLPLTILVLEQKGNDFTHKHYNECIPSKSMSIEVLIFLQSLFPHWVFIHSLKKYSLTSCYVKWLLIAYVQDLNT